MRIEFLQLMPLCLALAASRCSEVTAALAWLWKLKIHRALMVPSLMQAAAQFLLDDWAPESPEWYDESTATWHYDPYQQEDDHITGLKDICGADMVQQCLSDAQGAPLLPAARL